MRRLFKSSAKYKRRQPESNPAPCAQASQKIAKLEVSGRAFQDDGAVEWTDLQQYVVQGPRPSQEVRNVRAAARGASLPSTLPERVESGLHTPMPMHMAQVRLNRRQGAKSEQQAALRHWLESDDGQAWVKSQSILFHHGEGRVAA